MTAYAVANTNITAIGVLANTYAIRVARVEMASASTASSLSIFRYAGAGLSGGSTITPAVMRQGGPAATVTAKTGATASGTSFLFRQQSVAALSQVDYQFPFELIIQPGSAIVATSFNASNILAIYFEELRLSWSV